MKNNWLLSLILVLSTIAVYFSSLHNPFVLDDESQILENVFVQKLQPLSFYFENSTMNSGGSEKNSGLYYKPLMTLTYALLWPITPGDPFWYHTFQLCLHIFNGLMFFFLFHSFLKNHLLGFGLSLIFLLHPLQSEVVLHIANLQDTLFVFWGMVGVGMTLLIPNENFLLKVIVSSICFLLSLFSKESGLLFAVPLVWLCVTPDLKSLRRWIMASTGFFVALAIYFWIRLQGAQLDYHPYPLVEIGQAPFFERLLTFPSVFVHYLHLFFWPFEQKLVEDWVIREVDFKNFFLPLSELLLFFFLWGLGTLTLWTQKERPLFKTWLFFSLCFFAGVVVHSQFVPLDGTVADRWFYFTMVGWLGGLGVLGVLFSHHNFFKKWTFTHFQKMILILFIIIVYGSLSFRRSQEWASDLQLYQIEVTRNPQSFFMQNNLGVAYFRRGEIDKALPHFLESTRLKPQWSIHWNNLGAVYQRRGELELALQNYGRSIANGEYFLAYENYASVLYVLQRRDELRKFLNEKALPLFPQNQRLRALKQTLE